MRYSIEDTTLTALGDAVRNKTGKLTKIITVIEKAPAMKVSKTPNATGFETYEGDAPTTESFDVVSLPQATKIKVKLGYYNLGMANFLQIGEGSASDLTNFAKLTNIKKYSCDLPVKFQYKEEIFNSNTITFYYMGINNGDNIDLGYYAECIALDADGNEIAGETDVEVEKEVLNTMTPEQMAVEISNITSGLTAEELTITGDCGYRFVDGGWDWFINNYGDKITTKNITDANYMFSGSKIKEIPFELNFDPGSTRTLSRMFYDCYSLTNVPKFNNVKPSQIDYVFRGCRMLREIPEESVKDIDWSYIDGLSSSSGGSRSYTFQDCYSLRSFPMEFLNHGNPKTSSSYSIYSTLFSYCCSLDEIIDLPIPHTQATWTSNVFGSTFSYCCRLKNITFATQADGSPYVINGWSKQTIDLNNVGYGTAINAKYITDYNSGITASKRVKDDATYQALKNDPDWYSLDAAYSRYNHDSAVATINSLPDLSGGAGNNTIKFKGAAGSATDGGAINTLTAEEIAVATAKGWTVSLS